MTGLFLKNGKLINVLSGEIYKSDLRIDNGIITGYNKKRYDRIIDLNDKYIAPGFIESHIHLESTHILPIYAYKYFLKNGITTIINDPHEIANAGSVNAIIELIKASEQLPVDYKFMIPSCVPATLNETSGFKITKKEIKRLLKESNVIGLAEVMNYHGVINENRDIISKLNIFKNGIIDGHCPYLRGEKLDKYISKGIYSDHETIEKKEAIEKLRKGMYIMIRRGSASNNLNLINIINKRNDARFMLVSDDISINDMINNNHLIRTLRMCKSINKNIDTISLIRGITLNPSQYFRLYDRGIIAPGKIADIVILDNIKNFNINTVIKSGNIVYKNGRVFNKGIKKGIKSHSIMKIREFNKDDFILKYKGNFNIIKIIPKSLITEKIPIKLKGNLFEADIKNDILFIANIERYSGNSNYSIGLINGLGLKKGAIASTYNHDAHNILVIGADRYSMARAVNLLKTMGGGIVYVNDNERIIVPFDIYGVMSSLNEKTLYNKIVKLEKMLKKNGVILKNPLSQISFLCLSVIPHIKITDKGIVEL